MAPLAQTLALLAMTMATSAIMELPLDMAQDSFDDQYLNCGLAMTAALPALKDSDFEKNEEFSHGWKKATTEWQKRGSYSSSLTNDQAIALMVYTMKSMYSDFNKAVRTAGKTRQKYQDNFHFKTLHFLLTQALQKLRNPYKCLNVFRGVKNVQFNAKLHDKVHFGHFTSSSLNETVAWGYGTDTMFEVHTCHGVDIHNFSFNQREKEVLIPPFETFDITFVYTLGSRRAIWLNSTGKSSNYNCEWLRGGSLRRNSRHLGQLLLATGAVAVAIGTL